MRKRVMVVIDRTARAKHAMMWALTHVANKGDVMTLLHVLPPHCSASAHREEETSQLVNSLGSMCKAMRPQVMVPALTVTIIIGYTAVSCSLTLNSHL